MEKIRKERWGYFCEALRRHWPNLTDQEILSTQGKFEKVEALIEEKVDGSSVNVRETLAMIYDEVLVGNPESIDDFAGIERAKSDPNTPDSNEWEAREDQNNPEIGY